ncbi:MAG: M28 family peptidase [Planctomycetales bacterium]|nr:M28 family peptidase [Planctomycetales bacterium]
MKRLDAASWFLLLAIGLSIVGLAYVVARAPAVPDAETTLYTATGPLEVAQNPLDADRTFRYLEEICRIGVRFSGSEGMQQQQALLTRHFEQLGGVVQRQEFRVRHPLTGQPVSMANLVVQWHPERRERILLCAHYDTRPFPDRDPDPQARRGVFVGANDGGSGVAVLMELAHLWSKYNGKLGVDYVLFDGEELVYDEDRDEYFLGSRYFAESYVRSPPAYRYRGAILLDMVGDKHLNLPQEHHSATWRDTRGMTQSIWKTAQQMGVREFIPRRGYQLRDDHLMLHDIAKIPACDIIDFDYGPPGQRVSYWHTREDTPDKCSGESMAKVGWVVWTWLSNLR